MLPISTFWRQSENHGPRTQPFTFDCTGESRTAVESTSVLPISTFCHQSENHGPRTQTFTFDCTGESRTAGSRTSILRQICNRLPLPKPSHDEICVSVAVRKERSCEEEKCTCCNRYGIETVILIANFLVTKTYQPCCLCTPT